MGDSEEQMFNEIRKVPTEEREALMKEINFIITVPQEQGLALKSDLCLPSRKLRVMQRHAYIIHLYHSTNLQ